MLEHITNKRRENLLIERELTLTVQQEQLLDSILVDLLEKHKPLSYILGTVEFAGLELKIEPPLLIPRPETEEWCMSLIEHVKSLIIKINTQANNTPFTLVDVCTGSGCIALALAHAFPQIKVYALDINPQAIKLARVNAQALGIKNIIFFESDLLSALDKDLKVDLITANPPYIDPQIFNTLDPNVRCWEDYNALCAENKGLALIEKLTKAVPSLLTKRYGCGEFWCEIGYDQAAEVIELYKQAGFSDVIVLKDFADQARVVKGMIC